MSNNYLMEAEKAAAQRRRRAVLWCRIRCSVMELVRKPWKVLLIAVLCVVTVLVYGNKPAILALFPGDGRFKLPTQILSISFSAMIVLGFTVSLLGLLILLGTPLHAKRIETSLIHVGLTDRFGFPPVLVFFGKTSKRSAVRTMQFLSRGIAREEWEKRQYAIEDVLNCHFTEPITYGKSRNYIVLTVAPGVAATRTEPLYDDEL